MTPTLMEETRVEVQGQLCTFELPWRALCLHVRAPPQAPCCYPLDPQRCTPTSGHRYHLSRSPLRLSASSPGAVQIRMVRPFTPDVPEVDVACCSSPAFAPPVESGTERPRFVALDVATGERYLLGLVLVGRDGRRQEPHTGLHGVTHGV